MNRKLLHLCLLALAALALASCSHLPTSGGPPPPPTNATFNLTMKDVPPANTSVVSVLVPITGITLTPSSGSNVVVSSNTINVEMTRLSSDTFLLGSFSVPAGTYNSLNLTLGAPEVTFVNQTAGTVSGCAPNTACKSPIGAAGGISIATGAFPLTLTSGGQGGIALDINLNNALTSTGGALGLDFTLSNVLTAVKLPTTGTQDLIEDFTGKVTALNSSTQSVTIQSATKGALTATANSSTRFDNFNNPLFGLNCATANFACLAVNQTVSLDLGLNPDGSLTILEAELVARQSIDELEGTIVSIETPTQFTIALAEKTVAATNSLLTTNPPAVGDLIHITVGASTTFDVETKGFSAASFTNAITLFKQNTDTSNLLPGQNVMVTVTAFSPGGVSTLPTATTNFVWLRFSRLTANISIAPSTSGLFDIDRASLPPFMATAGNAQVQAFTGTPATVVEGATDINSLAAGNNISMRTLLINRAAPPFYVAKIRKH